MTDQLVFHTHPMSRGRIVRWMLEEIGCPYRTLIRGTNFPDLPAEKPRSTIDIRARFTRPCGKS
jgi:glutathione S-transferase